MHTNLKIYILYTQYVQYEEIILEHLISRLNEYIIWILLLNDDKLYYENKFLINNTQFYTHFILLFYIIRNIIFIQPTMITSKFSYRKYHINIFSMRNV